MSSRRQAREWALQILFELDANARTTTGADESFDLSNTFFLFWATQLSFVNETRPEEEQIHIPHVKDEDGNEIEDGDYDYNDLGWQDHVAPGIIRRFAECIVEGVVKHLPAIDRAIEWAAPHWPIHRMGGVERGALRMGIYEILYTPETPVPVVINEAIDVCKYFGMRDSARFVNGILDNIAKHRSSAPFEPQNSPLDTSETWSPE